MSKESISLSGFQHFTTLRIYLIIGDIVSFIIQRMYKNLEANVLDSILDPYFTDEYLDTLEVSLPIFNKSKFKYGHFLINLLKNMIFIFLTYVVYLIVKKYKKN